MAEQYYDNLSNETEVKAGVEFILGGKAGNSAGEDITEANVVLSGDHESETYDGKLSTIPEETDSVASKVGDVERKDTLRIDVNQEEKWPIETAEVAAQDAVVPVNGESVVSGVEHLVSIAEEDLGDGSADHASHVEQHRNLMMELTVAKHRNMLLQKKVLEHFKKRKQMDSISKTEDLSGLDLEMKYLKQLQEFRQFKDELSEEEQQRENEIEEFKKQTRFLNESVHVKLNELVTYINHTAERLQTAKAIKMPPKPNKTVECLTGRLVARLGELSRLQLTHIKLRNRVAAQQERKSQLEECGEVLHLASYVKLRAENQRLAGKVEDRDEELQGLRERAMMSAHHLAHVRQKAWATERAVEEKTSQLHALEEQFAKMRDEMNALKKQREHYRAGTQRLRQSAGLLMEPALLRDYEQSMEEVTRLSAELQNVRNSYYDDQHKLTSARNLLRLTRLQDHPSSVQCVQISIPCQRK